MSGGQQASLAVARALVNEPRLVLVDEPSAGLSPKMQHELRAVLQVVKDSGVTMVLVEQNIAFGLSLVDTANLLQTGTVVHSGPVHELDEGTLATHLGIGRVFAGTTGSALSARKGA
jgi:branched-chain amino acid transport system ATP-binding protein